MSDNRTDRVELQGGVTHLEEYRQAILLALSELALSRPGWDMLLRTIAEQMNGLEMFEGFKRTSEDLVADRAKASELRTGLEELVKLQGHYAKLLNTYDGGERIAFQNAEEWLTRLRVVATGEKAETKP